MLWRRKISCSGNSVSNYGWCFEKSDYTLLSLVSGVLLLLLDNLFLWAKSAKIQNWAETSEIWIQKPRGLSASGMQFASYNMTGQRPHAAHLLPHIGHAFFNPAAAQSSLMLFPGLYHHPPQPTGIANHHHLGPATSGNVGVEVAAATLGAQMDVYQQQPLG